jgi:hypothetical protein
VVSRATIFRFQPLFSIKIPSNATGRVSFVMSNMLNVHLCLWWWFGLSLWFLLPCSSVLLPSYCLSSALAAIKQPRHFFACRVVHFYECVVKGAVCRGYCESDARQSDERASVYLDAVEFCACEATHFCFPSLHQKTAKFHRPTVACGDQCAGGIYFWCCF